MPVLRTCKQCGTVFTAKPSLVERGMAIFCSRFCSYESLRAGEERGCVTCGRIVYKTRKDLERSKSGKFFCGKSCQTIWRNKEFSRDKHKNWKGGSSTYRTIAKQNGDPVICSRCGARDMRILAVHHMDENHGNNDPGNLQWLCHNCHYLTHLDLKSLKTTV